MENRDRRLQPNMAVWLLFAAGVLLPWVVPYSSLPYASFYREWGIALLFGIALLLIAKNHHFDLLRKSSLFPVFLMFGVVFCLQVAIDHELWPKNLLAIFYLIFLASSYALGAILRQSLKESLEYVFSLILAAALLSCVFAAVQLGFGDAADPFVMPRLSSGRLYGNIAQSNHFADLLWLAVMTIAPLYAVKKIRAPIGLLAIVIFVSFSIFTVSRSVWLYAFVAIFAGIFCCTGEDLQRKQYRPLAKFFFTAAVLLPVLSFIYQYSGFLEYYELGASASRLVKGDAGGEMLRLWLWKCGLLAAIEHPWLGLGVGRFVGFSSALAGITPDAPISGGDSNAHNIFFHVAAELGIPAALVLLGSIAIGFLREGRRLFRENTAPAVLSALAMLSVMLIHACLEYPLWFTYFIGLYGVLLGLLETRTHGSATIGSKRPWLQIMGGVLLLGSLLGYQQYRHLEVAMQEIAMQAGVGGIIMTSSSIEQEMNGIFPWSPFRNEKAAITLISAKPGVENAEVLSASCSKAIEFSPSPYLLARCSAIHFVAGRSAMAQAVGERLCKLYPNSASELARSYSIVITNNDVDKVPPFSCINYQK